MSSPISRLRRWFALGAIFMIVIVSGMYLYARWRVRAVVHEIPAKIGLDIQQTADGFSISKSSEGRTQFTVSASKAVQYKDGGHAQLHNVKIVIYGKDSNRFDRISGDNFDYDPTSGNVAATGTVLIDLEADPEGIQRADQAPPEKTKDPIHLESQGLVFNKNTGDASATGKVVFATPQASGSAVGIEYVAKTGIMKLLSAVEVDVQRPQPVRLDASRGVITKQPREVVLADVRMNREQQQMRSEQATFFLRDDNTVDRIFAEGDVQSVIRGRAPSNSETQERSDRAELFLTGTRNQLTTAILSGNVRMVSEDGGSSDSEDREATRQNATNQNSKTQGAPAEASAGRVTLHFAGEQVLETVHAEEGVKLSQKGKENTANQPGKTGSQDVELSAPVMDFFVKDGRVLDRAETSGPPQILITQPGSNQKTLVTALKFTAKFTDKNRLDTLHGAPDAKIVSSGGVAGKNGSAAADRISTSEMLDVVFGRDGGVQSITQSGAFGYTDGPQKAWAQRGEYTTSDQMLVLTGSPRVVDTGMVTTAQTMRMNRTTGDAIAEGNVKTTYSDLKPQPDGGMLASSDPIHVTSRTMTAHHSPGIAVYTGDARLWQNANVVQAPTLQFDRDHRSVVAQGTATQPVSTVLVEVDKQGKVIPVNITSARLNYVDAERRIFLDGGVTAKGSDATMTAEQMTVFLLPRDQSKEKMQPGTPGQIERIIAENHVVLTEPTRHANGERLVYTTADDKFVLTGGSPSIFDAERGKTSGDSLTFFRHDDRVLVEGKDTSPTVTRTQVAR